MKNQVTEKERFAFAAGFVVGLVVGAGIALQLIVWFVR